MGEIRAVWVGDEWYFEKSRVVFVSKIMFEGFGSILFYVVVKGIYVENCAIFEVKWVFVVAFEFVVIFVFVGGGEYTLKVYFCFVGVSVKGKGVVVVKDRFVVVDDFVMV